MANRKEAASHLKPDQPGTAQDDKADATYRSAPHTFHAGTSPDGTVTLTVQQNYTGKRQWFRFDKDQWDRLFTPPQDIYISVRDPAGDGSSDILGAFSTEEKARAAAQESEGDGAKPLDWKDTQAEADDGDTYDVILVSLDTPNF